jgi:SAM-dependent methyltransferase
MSDSSNVQEIMDRIRQRVRLRHPVGDARNSVESTSAAQLPVPPPAALSLYDLSRLHHNLHVSNSQWNSVGIINPRRPGLHNRLLQVVKKALQRMLTWYTRPLHEFHASVVRVLNETTNAIENLQENEETINSRVGQQLGKIDALHKTLLPELEGLQNQFTELQGRQHVELQGLQNQFMELRTQVLGAADTHLGAKARNGLWFNEPIILQYDSAGQPSWSSTTERIIERTWVLRHLSDVPPGAKIVDLGCSESTLGLELASNGFDVVGIDVRNHPLTHPNFEFIQQDICESKLPENTFDAAIALSTIEHIGLGAYGDPKGEGLDRVAMKEVYRILKPGGVLLLTTPFGKPAVTSLHRIVDSNSLRALLGGFDIRLLEFGIKVDTRTWVNPVNESQADRDLDSSLGPGAVALVKAYKPR